MYHNGTKTLLSLSANRRCVHESGPQHGVLSLLFSCIVLEDRSMKKLG